MLVIISDLHFTNGTTSNKGENGADLFNVSPNAFRLFTARLSDIIERRNSIVFPVSRSTL